MEDISMRGAVVRISQDSMEAYLTLQPPEAGEGYTLSELVRYIRTQRVTNGIDEAAIQEMIDGGVYMSRQDGFRSKTVWLIRHTGRKHMRLLQMR